MRISRRLMVFLSAALLAGACGGDANAPNSAFLGRYALILLDGQPLPLTIIDQPSLVVAIHDDTLTLNANKSFTNAVNLSSIVDGVAAPLQHLSCTGTYTRSGNSFTLTTVASEDCSGDTLTGTLDGNTLTVQEDTGEILVFRR